MINDRMKETETLELKKSLIQLKEGVISLSAMLNKSGCGTVIFGVDDDGRTHGITIGAKTLREISIEIKNNLKPLPEKIETETLGQDGKTTVKVTAQGSDSPYSAYGRYYIRMSDSDISMPQDMLRKFFENKEDSYVKWEKRETECDVENANEILIIDCIREANEKGRLDYVYRNAAEALNKLGLLTENGKLNNAGRYLFGKDKPLTIKEANYPTDGRTEFGEIKEFRGNIIECMKEAMSYVRNHITFKSEIIGERREESPEIPLRAIREIVVNSFAHCSYARQGDFNQYAIYRSSVRIYNPGSIIKGTDPLRFASGKVGSKIRNPLIASVLFKCGYIDAFGTGFDRTFTLCAQAGVEYEYSNDDFGFTFTFARNANFLNDKANDIINDRINGLDCLLLSLMRKNKYMTIAEMADATGKSAATVQRHLDGLMKKGALERVGSRKNGCWKAQ